METTAPPQMLAQPSEDTPGGTPGTTVPGAELPPSGTTTLSAQLSSYFPSTTVSLTTASTTPPRLYTDPEIHHISQLLTLSSLPTWSHSPRLYIVLRLINALPLLDPLLAAGISDFWFPFTLSTLPSTLASAEIRAAFVAAQHAVLTKAVDIEKGELGRHRHFGEGEEVPFDVVGTLGVGGYGAVDRVRSRLSGLEYARKRMRRGRVFRRAKEAMREFKVEVEVLKRLRHRHVVELVGSYSDSAWVGLILAPVADGDLGWWLRRVEAEVDGQEREGMVDLTRGWIGCLGVGLAYLHERSVRHKDIKPGNILVKGGQVLFTDFGLSLDTTEMSRSTTQGASALTPRYCAPEVADFEPRNASSDVWSLGVVWLEMVSVMKGVTIAGMKEFYERVGTRSQFCRNNVEGNEEWMKKLEGLGRKDDNKPLRWIKEMLQVERAKRPAAQEMVAMVLRRDQFTGKRTEFCGSCCLDELDERSSDEDAVEAWEDWDELDNDHRTPVTTQPVSTSEPAVADQTQSSPATAHQKHPVPATANEANTRPPLGNQGHASRMTVERRTGQQGSSIYIQNSSISIKDSSISITSQKTESPPSADTHPITGQGPLPVVSNAVTAPRINPSESKKAENPTESSSMAKSHSNQDFSLLETPPVYRSRVNPPPPTPFLSRSGTPSHKGASAEGSTSPARMANTGKRPSFLTNAFSSLATLIKDTATTTIGSQPSSAFSNTLPNLPPPPTPPFKPLSERSVAMTTAPQPAAYTPIMTAIQTGDTLVVYNLLQTLSSPGALDPGYGPGGGLPLLKAVQMGQTQVVHLILSHGVYGKVMAMYLKTPEWGPKLLFAAMKWEWEMAQLLLAYGAVIDETREKDGMTLLHTAVLYQNLEAVQTLVDVYRFPCDCVNRQGHTPLQTCVLRPAILGNVEIAKFLISRGAEVKRLRSALLLPVQTRNEEMIRFLVEAGVDVNEPVLGKTPLAWAMVGKSDAIAKMLLELGANESHQSVVVEKNKMGLVSDQPKFDAAAFMRGQPQSAEFDAMRKAKAGRKVDLQAKGALLLCVKEGFEDEVHTLLKNGVENVDMKDDLEGRTPLGWAANRGFEGIVIALLEWGARADAKDNRDRTALHLAADGGHRAAAEALLAKGADVGSRDDRECTALHLAAGKDNVPLVELLLGQGANINAHDDEGNTPLHYAALRRGRGVINSLIQMDPELINARTADGKTMLHCAIKNRERGIAEWLMSIGIDVDAVDKWGYTALILAIQTEQTSVVPFLVQHTQNINIAATSDGKTALHIAASKGNMELVRMLLGNGANANAMDKGGWNPLYWAAKEGHKAVVQILLDHHGDINARNVNGWTALYFAAYCGQQNFLKLLINKGADINAACDRGEDAGKTPLHVAIDKKHAQAATLLIDAGGALGVKCKYGRTPLHYAVMRHEFGMVQLLVKTGADVNAKAKNGGTPLHDALTWWSDRIVHFLVDSGADVDAVMDSGENCITLASYRGDKATIRWLQSKSKREVPFQEIIQA